MELAIGCGLCRASSGMSLDLHTDGAICDWRDVRIDDSAFDVADRCAGNFLAGGPSAGGNRSGMVRDRRGVWIFEVGQRRRWFGIIIFGCQTLIDQQPCCEDCGCDPCCQICPTGASGWLLRIGIFTCSDQSSGSTGLSVRQQYRFRPICPPERPTTVCKI